MMDDSHYIKTLFEKYNIDSIFLKLDNKYETTLIDRIVYDYRVMDKQGFVTSKWDTLSSFFIKVIVILGGALISSIKTIKIRRLVKNTHSHFNSTIIALPFGDHIVRFKRLRKLISHDVDMYYHPLFHFNSMIRHIDVYNSSEEQLYLDRFRVKDIFHVFVLILIHYKSVSKCSLELDAYFESKTCKLPGVIIFGILYSLTFTRFIEKLDSPEKTRIWLLDYDFDYKYAIFNNVIHRLRPSDKTVHIQHGSFVGYSAPYCNPSSDYSLCCSPREKDIINNYNKHLSHIDFLGAPLQSFIDDSDLNVPIEFDILILLSSTYDSALKNLQIDFLSKFNFKNFRVKVRYRPASKIDDEKELGQYCADAVISEGDTLLADVYSSKTIISFSLDALYPCLRHNKRIVVLEKDNAESDFDCSLKSDNILLFHDSNIALNFDWKGFVDNYSDCDYSKDQFVLYNFGINNFDMLSERFNNFLISIWP